MGEEKIFHRCNGVEKEDFKTLYVLTLYNNFSPAIESKPLHVPRGHVIYNIGRGLHNEFSYSYRCVGEEKMEKRKKIFKILCINTIYNYFSPALK